MTSSADKEALIRRLYYDPETGLTGLTKLYHRAYDEDQSITIADVRAFMRKQELVQVNTTYAKQQSFVPQRPRQQYQIDLVELQNPGLNKGIKYAFMCIDAFTKRADVEPMTSKTGEASTNAFRVIIERMGRNVVKKNSTDKYELILTTAPLYPESVYCDEGSEFLNASFKSLLDEHGIELIETTTHASMIERFNRTFKTLLERALQAGKTRTFTTLLPKILYNYNTSYHTTIKMSPYEVTEQNADIVYRNINERAKRRVWRENLKVGDKVRPLLKVRGLTHKGYMPKWSPRVHTIIDISGKYYTLDEGVKGEKKRRYLRFALQKVKESPEGTVLAEPSAFHPDLSGTVEGQIQTEGLRVPRHQSARRRKELTTLFGREVGDLERARLKALPSGVRTRNRKSSQ